MKQRVLWWRDVRWPMVAFVLLAIFAAVTSLDVFVAHRYFFDSSTMTWRGADSWWLNEFLHTGGRWAIRVIAAVSLTLWVWSNFNDRLRSLRRASGYFSIALIGSVSVIGLIKSLTHVDCPWDLLEFGGRYEHVLLFDIGHDVQRHGHCFPAAHSSSGYALMALYFLFREHKPKLARWGLGVGIVTGLIFGIAQQMRGAHFVSHDVWSAFIVWLIVSSVYYLGFDGTLWSVQTTCSQTVEQAER